MAAFTLSITIPDNLLEVEEAELISSTLQTLAKDIQRWRAVPTSRKLRDRAGKIVGWVELDEEEADAY